MVAPPPAAAKKNRGAWRGKQLDGEAAEAVRKNRTALDELRRAATETAGPVEDSDVEEVGGDGVGGEGDDGGGEAEGATITIFLAGPSL